MTLQATQSSHGQSTINFGEALNAATRHAMELDPNVFIYGLGVDSPAGIFGSTRGLLEQFGEKRIFDTPVSEQVLTSMAAGAANAGLRPILVHQRLDFMLYTMDQIVNWISLWHFKSFGQSKMPLTIRMIVGKGWGQGPQHAKSLHSWFAHVPGLKVVIPGTPFDAKGLLFSSIMSDDPVLFIEGRSLYSMEEEVPDEAFMIPFGEAITRRSGTDITIATFGSMVPQVLQASEKLAAHGICAEVIDMRTLAPLDIDSVIQSVSRTHRLLVAEPGWRHFGAAAEIIAGVCESIGPELEAAPSRVTWPHSHIPTSPPLETAYYPSTEDIVTACMRSFDKS
jgi:acetoin:2,6-dichlorophenolindophenol oxidoreductase subunit beta